MTEISKLQKYPNARNIKMSEILRCQQIDMLKI